MDAFTKQIAVVIGEMVLEIERLKMALNAARSAAAIDDSALAGRPAVAGRFVTGAASDETQK